MTVDRSPEQDKPAAAGAAQPRGYYSPRRKAQADATRSAIAAAAMTSFTERGWAGTTVRGVAHAAGVAEPTVYAAYGNKAGLAHALIDAVGSSADTDQQAAELAAAAGDPAGQLAAMVDFDIRLYAHGGGVLAALRDAARSDPALSDAYASGRAGADALRRQVLSAWPPGALRHGLSLGEAVDTYAALCNVDVFRVLTDERGWSTERVGSWLHRTLCQLLLA